MPNNAGMEQITPVEKAAGIVGGLTVLARMLGVSAPTVHEWKVLKRPVPAMRCTAIEQATGGKVTRKELRPLDWMDIWPELVVKKIEPNQAPALTPTAQAATESIAELPPLTDVPLPPLMPEEPPPWDGVDRRDFLRPGTVPADLERRQPGVEAAGQGA